ncbi:MAG: ATP-binding protein [Solirubrobacterales bacterium]|nr:ATP-binding protein [Solirubrobacterales bacterium]
MSAPAGWLESLVCVELRRHPGAPGAAAPTRHSETEALRRLTLPGVLVAALAEGSRRQGRRARPGAGSGAGPRSARGAGASSQPGRATASSSVWSPTADSRPTLAPRPGPPTSVGAAPSKDVSTARLDATLTRDREAPRVARQQLAQWLCRQLNEREVRDATLLVSELVTNALVHGRGTIELHALLDENHLIVEVIDNGKGFELVVPKRDVDSVGGWGLSLVDALASRWGIRDGTSHVWFELERCGRRPGPLNKPHA